MSRFSIRNRNGILIVDPSHVAYVKADSNYVHIFFRSQQELYIHFSFADIFSLLNSHAEGQDHFVKIGRSLIVNIRLITKILLRKNQLTLADNTGWTLTLDLPHKTLNRLCQQLEDYYSSDSENTYSEKHTDPSDNE